VSCWLTPEYIVGYGACTATDWTTGCAVT
jgi:hypothetical protein